MTLDDPLALAEAFSQLPSTATTAAFVVRTREGARAVLATLSAREGWRLDGEGVPWAGMTWKPVWRLGAW